MTKVEKYGIYYNEMANNKKKIGLLVEKDIYAKAKILADNERWSLSKLANVAFENYLRLRRIIKD